MTFIMGFLMLYTSIDPSGNDRLRLGCAQLTHVADIPTVFLVEHDLDLRGVVAEGLRVDGMNIVEFHRSAQALAAIAEGARPAVLVIAPEGDGLITCKHIVQAKAMSPRTQIVLVLEPGGDPEIPPGSHVLVKPFKPSKLSRFIRLAVAKPALRSTLQASYRRAHSAPAGATPGANL